MNYTRHQINPSLLGVGREVNPDGRSGCSRPGDEDVLGRFRIGESEVRGVHRHVDHYRRAAAEIGADIGGEITALGKDRDTLPCCQVAREIVEFRDGTDRDRRGSRRVAKIALGDAPVIQSEDADDNLR